MHRTAIVDGHCHRSGQNDQKDPFYFVHLLDPKLQFRDTIFEDYSLPM